MIKMFNLHFTWKKGGGGMLCYLNVTISDVTNVLCFPNEGGRWCSMVLNNAFSIFLFFLFWEANMWVCPCSAGYSFPGKEIEWGTSPYWLPLMTPIKLLCIAFTMKYMDVYMVVWTWRGERYIQPRRLE